MKDEVIKARIRGPGGSPACVDCAWFNREKSDREMNELFTRENGEGFWACRYPRSGFHWHPVLGWEGGNHRWALDCREDPARCGPAGQWFEEK